MASRSRRAADGDDALSSAEGEPAAIVAGDGNDRILADIHETAKHRTPKRITHGWLRFEEPPPGVLSVLVDVSAEDTAAAHEFASSQLEPRLLRRESMALDFRNLRVCTQSFLHALLHETVRLAWARKVPMFVIHAAPAVQAQLEFVESYSLGG